MRSPVAVVAIVAQSQLAGVATAAQTAAAEIVAVGPVVVVTFVGSDH